MGKLVLPGDLGVLLKEQGLRVSDIVLYLLSSCNLRCKHCYVGNELLAKNTRIDFGSLVEFLSGYHWLDRLTLVGGEPLLYPQINELISVASRSTIVDRRITTNGTSFFHLNPGTDLSGFNIAVSIDGAQPSTHDYYRGHGAFEKTIKIVPLLAKRCRRTIVTSTLTKRNVDELYSLIALVKHLGCDELNLHCMSLQGNAKLISDEALHPSEWTELHSYLTKLQNSVSERPLTVRIPLLFVDREDQNYSALMAGYHPHVHKSFYSDSGQRIAIYADGRVYISSELFGTEHHIGQISGGKYFKNDLKNSEIGLISATHPNLNRYSQAFHDSDGRYEVLSVSYKREFFV